MASYRRKGPSAWEAQVRRVGWPGLARTFPTKGQAQQWATNVELEMSRGDYVDKSQLETTCAGDLFRRYLREETPKKKGAQSEAYRLNAFLRQPLAELRLSCLNKALMARWRDERLQSVSGSAVKRDLNLLSHVFNVAANEWGYPLVNPIKGLRRPAENRSRVRRLSWSEMRRLMRALKAHTTHEGRYVGTRNAWIAPLVKVALRTAMRRGELLALSWEDVHLESSYLRVRDSKNGDAREVPLSSKARRVLAQLPGERAGNVFPITAASVKKAFERAVVRAGIADLHFHDLRHDATTRLAGRLSNVLELSSVTGHRTLAMLKRYFHPSATELARRLG